MPKIRLFAQASDVAGCRSDEVDGTSVNQVLEEAVARYGLEFSKVLAISQVWLNGNPYDAKSPEATVVLNENDEVAILPPISGGCCA